MDKIKRLCSLILVLVLFGAQTVFANAPSLSDTPILGANKGESAVSETKAVESNEALPVTTNGTGSKEQVTVNSEIAKPSVASEAAVLYDATTGQILFGKNQDKSMYPASTTKIMTVLLAAEKLSPSAVIPFNASATDNLESGYTNVYMVKGDTMTCKDACYAILLKSACEVSNAVAEKVSGTQTAFAKLMNERAKELGCTNTNFKNASGLNDSTHTTTASDLAKIAAAAFANETFRTVAGTKTYTLPASKKRGSLKLTNSNKMLYSSNAEYMEGIVGGKTGYTSKAGNTLVEALDTNGHELIAVVMKSNGKQYSDTKALFEYGKKLIAAGESVQKNQTGSWEKTGVGKKYLKADGTYAASEWLTVRGDEYYFGSDGVVATGWKQFTNGAWYYFDPETGAMAHDKWVSTDGKYYYLQSDGVLATDTVIDGMYRVNENGIYVEKVG